MGVGDGSSERVFGLFTLDGGEVARLWRQAAWCTITAVTRWRLCCLTVACALSACGKPLVRTDAANAGAATASAPASASTATAAVPAASAEARPSPSRKVFARPRFTPLTAARPGANKYGLVGLYRESGSWHVASVHHDGVRHVVEVQSLAAAAASSPLWSWSDRAARTRAPLGVIGSSSGGAPWVVFPDAERSGRILAQRMAGADSPIVLIDASRTGAHVKAHAHAFAQGDPPRAVVAVDGVRSQPLSQAERARRARAEQSGLYAEWPAPPIAEVWTSVAATGARPVLIARRRGRDGRRPLARVALRPGGAGAMYWNPPASPTGTKRNAGVLLLDEAGGETRRLADPFPGVATDIGPIAFDGQGTLFVVARRFRSQGPHQILRLTASGDATSSRELSLPGADVVGEPALVACAGVVWAVTPAAVSSPEPAIVVYLARLLPGGALKPARTGFVRPRPDRGVRWRLTRLTDRGAFGCDGERAAAAYLLPDGGTGDLWGIALIEWDAKTGQSTP